jgi:cullin 3
MESGLNHMLRDDKISDLSRMFQLFRRVDPEHRILTHNLSAFIQEVGKEINAGLQQLGAKGKETEKAALVTSEPGLAAAMRWVELVLNMKSKYDHILSEAFGNEQKMRTCVVEGFSQFINSHPKTPEFVSLFIDENLKKGIKGKTEQEVDAILDDATILFRYIADKDVFETYYKSHLAKRLLHGRSVSDDAERGMLTKLRLEAGYAFTTKLEGMFRDMKVSRDLMAEYKNQVARTEENPGPDLSVSILTSTYWPLSFQPGGGVATCVFPPVIEKVRRSFTNFYLGRHSGRQLSWPGGMVLRTSTCLIIGFCGSESDVQESET